MLDQVLIEAIAREHYARRLEEDREERYAFGRAHSIDEITAFPIDHAARLDRIRRQLAFGDHREILPQAKAILAARGEYIEDGSRPLSVVCEHLLRAELEVARRAVERNQAIYWGQPDDPLFRSVHPHSVAAATPAAVPAFGSGPLPAPLASPPTAAAVPCSVGPAVEPVITPSAALTTAAATDRRAAPRPVGLGHKADLDVAAITELALAEKKIGAKMAAKYRAAAHALIAVIGRKPVWSITIDDLIHFKDTLLDAPARFNTQHKFASIREAAADNRQRRDARAADARQPKPLPTLSTKTINANYLSPLRQIFDYAADNQATPDKINIAATIRVKGGRGKNRRKAELRLPFEQDALERLFAAPLFTGAHSEKRLLRQGTHLESGWKFWLPLVMYLMGVRPSELGQAEVGDVLFPHGWPCLKITTDLSDDEDEVPSGKSVKTPAGERLLPIHPELLRLGFLDWVEARRAEGEKRLFPDWRCGCDGTYSMTSSKVFNRRGGYLEGVGIKSDRHALYSLRHSYKDTLRRSWVFPEYQDFLMGHAAANEYGKIEVNIPLIEAVIALDFGGVKLSHIQPRIVVKRRTFQVGTRKEVIEGFEAVPLDQW